MQSHTKDLLSGVCILVFAICVFTLARDIQSRLPIGVDSGFLPEIASAILAFVALTIIAKGVWGHRDHRPLKHLSRTQMQAVAVTLALVGLYVGLIDTLGFVIATAFYLPAQFHVLSAPDSRSIFRFMGIGLAISLTIYTLFTAGFGLILPTGNLISGF